MGSPPFPPAPPYLPLSLFLSRSLRLALPSLVISLFLYVSFLLFALALSVSLSLSLPPLPLTSVCQISQIGYFIFRYTPSTKPHLSCTGGMSSISGFHHLWRSTFTALFHLIEVILIRFHLIGRCSCFWPRGRCACSI